MCGLAVKLFLFIQFYLICAREQRIDYVFGKEGETLTLVCPKTTNPSIWQGPPEFTLYSKGRDFSSIVKNRNRFSIVGDSTEIKYNLQIHNFTSELEGLYKCISFSGGVIHSTVYHLLEAEQPYLKHKNGSLTFYTILQKPASISVQIVSYQTPVGIWLGGQGGQLGRWFVATTNETNVYQLQSYVKPTAIEHFGIYIMKVRNDAGSFELQLSINAVKKPFPTQVYPQHLECNMSSEVQMECVVQTSDQAIGNIQWHHYLNNKLLRRLNSTSSQRNDTFLLTLPNCHHDDIGKYFCVENGQNMLMSGSATLYVKGRPLISKTIPSYQESFIVLSVYFYADPIIESYVWYYKESLNEVRIQNSSSTIITDKTESVIEMELYDQNISLSGYQLKLKILDTVLQQYGMYLCYLQNAFGATEVSFDIKKLQELGHLNGSIDKRYAVLTTVPPETVSTTNDSNYSGDFGNLSFIILTVGISIAFLLTTFAVICIKIRLYRVNKSNRDLVIENQELRRNNQGRPPIRASPESEVSSPLVNRTMEATADVHGNEQAYSYVDNAAFLPSDGDHDSSIGSLYEVAGTKYEDLNEREERSYNEITRTSVNIENPDIRTNNKTGCNSARGSSHSYFDFIPESIVPRTHIISKSNELIEKRKTI